MNTAESRHAPRVALVTGGARGIGAAISEGLARAGYHVAIGYSSRRDTAEELAESLRVHGRSISIHQGNVGVPADCQRASNDPAGIVPPPSPAVTGSV